MRLLDLARKNGLNIWTGEACPYGKRLLVNVDSGSKFLDSLEPIMPVAFDGGQIMLTKTAIRVASEHLATELGYAFIAEEGWFDEIAPMERLHSVGIAYKYPRQRYKFDGDVMSQHLRTSVEVTDPADNTAWAGFFGLGGAVLQKKDVPSMWFMCLERTAWALANRIDQYRASGVATVLLHQNCGDDLDVVTADAALVSILVALGYEYTEWRVIVPNQPRAGGNNTRVF